MIHKVKKWLDLKKSSARVVDAKRILMDALEDEIAKRKVLDGLSGGLLMPEEKYVVYYPSDNAEDGVEYVVDKECIDLEPEETCSEESDYGYENCKKI